MIGKLLGIDHGIARIGLAVSDPLGIAARALRIVERTSKVEDFALINRIARDEQVVAVVIGIPYNDAPQGVHTQADTVRLWGERYSKTTRLPIVYWDEQLTSEDAKELAKLQKRSPRDPIDDLAAQLILQSYLNALSDGLATLPSHS